MSAYKQTIDVINKNSLNIYDALDKGTLKIDKLYEIIKNKDKDKLCKIKEISESNKKVLMSELNKFDLLDEILSLTGNRYKHLKDVRNIINLDNLIGFVFNDNLYLEKVKLYYSNLLIEKILEKYYDYEDIKILSKCKEELIDIERNINTRITKKIDEFYIKMITK